MAQYKVIQDVEAEDKLVGPLSLKSFIYAAVTFVCGFINFKIIISGGSPLKYLLFLAFLPPMVLFGVLASPLGREQPTEVWLLAKIRFFIKPRQRLWDQTGVSKLVTITAPQKYVTFQGKGLSEMELQSRLQTLAATMDSRGWAIKNLGLPKPSDQNSDRLVAPTSTSAVAADVDIDAADDILDEQNNPVAQNLKQMMEQLESRRKVDVANKLNEIRKDSKIPLETKPATPVTPRSQAAKLELAQSGSALSVATVAKLANRNAGEVVIQLH